MTPYVDHNTPALAAELSELVAQKERELDRLRATLQRVQARVEAQA